MRGNSVLRSFACGLAALTACDVAGAGSSAIVTEAVNQQETELAPAGPDLEVAAGDYVWSYQDQLDLGLGSEDELDVFKVSESGGLRHARVRQIHAGIPVFGADLVVHADDTTFLGFNGYLTKHLEGFDVTASLAQEAAMNAAKDDLSGGAALSYQDESATLVILPGKQGGADLAWHVELHNSRSEGIDAGIWNYFIDARTGAVLQKFDSLATLSQGSGPGGGPKSGKVWTSELDVEMSGDGYIMDTEKLQTADRSKGDTVITSTELQNFMDKEGNNAHGYAEVTLNMMRDWMGHDSLDDAGFKIVSLVHDTEACGPQNACWNGSQMFYGDGGGDFYPFAGSLDVVGHELNHGFTEFHSNLTYDGQSGGLNESFSDIAGTCAEFYFGGGGDFEIGEDIYAPGALRYMCEPTKDGDSIGDAGDYEDGMDVHNSSGVPNRAFCLAVARFKTIGDGAGTVGAVQMVGEIWYAANASYWTSGTDFAQACQTTLGAARSVGWDGEAAQALADSWADTGVWCNPAVFVCNGDGTCDAKDGETCASCAEDCGACSDDCNAFEKAKCADGIGDCRRCSATAGCGDGVCDGDETDSSCPGDCGCAAVSCDAIAPFGCYCDAGCAETGDCCADANTCDVGPPA